MLPPLETPLSGPSSTTTGGERAALFCERAFRVLAKVVVAVAVLLWLRLVGLELLSIWQIVAPAATRMPASKAPEFVLGYGECLFSPPPYC